MKAKLKKVMLIYIAILLVFLFSGSCIYAIKTSEEMWSDMGRDLVYKFTDFEGKSDQDDRPYSSQQALSLRAIKIYQKVISPGNGSSCMMSPSCSNFALQSFRKYNPFKAFMLSSDRLNRCGHDLDMYQEIEVNGVNKALDLVPLSKSIPSRENDNNNYEGALDNVAQLHSFEVFDDSLLIDNSAEDEKIFNYAQKLESIENYDSAIKEYQRLLSYYPHSQYRMPSFTAIFRCYYKTKQYIVAINWGESILSNYEKLEEQAELQFYIGASYFKLGNMEAARKYFAYLETEKNNSYNEKSMMLIGLSHALEYNWDYAYQAFSKIENESLFFKNARLCAQLAKEGKHLKYKSPKIAGFLSIIPGVGYWYSGYKQTAISAAIVNGLLINGAVESFEGGEKSLGTFVGLIGLGWYSGNIYGAIDTAKKNNEFILKRHLAKFDVGFKF